MLSTLRARLFLLLGILLPVGSCVFGLDTKPGMTVQQSIVATGEALSGNVRAVGGNGSVVVSGRIIGKLPCDVVRGGLKEVGGGNLEVTITLEATRACPGNPPTSFNYLANIVAVQPGSRSVVVEHRFVGTEGQAGVVLDTTVTVN